MKSAGEEPRGAEAEDQAAESARKRAHVAKTRKPAARLPRRILAAVGRWFRTFFSVAVEAGRDWFADGTLIYAAALAYHALLALAPLVIIAVGILGLIYGQGVVEELTKQAELHLSVATANAVDVVLKSWNPSAGANTIAVAIGVVFSLVGAAGAFRTLRRALDTIWRVEPAPAELRVKSLAQIAFGQILMVLFVIGMALMVVALVVISTGWSWLTGHIEATFALSGAVLRVADVLVSFGVTALTIELVFHMVPMAKMHRADRWTGALLSAVLFTVGKEAFGVYMSHSSTASAYGAAGSLIVFLIWVYYSAWIVFYGAEVAKVYGRRRGREAEPRRGARRMSAI